MTLTNNVYQMRKRLSDKVLLKLQKIIEEEIDRRLIADDNTKNTMG